MNLKKKIIISLISFWGVGIILALVFVSILALQRNLNIPTVQASPAICTVNDDLAIGSGFALCFKRAGLADVCFARTIGDVLKLTGSLTVDGVFAVNQLIIGYRRVSNPCIHEGICDAECDLPNEKVIGGGCSTAVWPAEWKQVINASLPVNDTTWRCATAGVVTDMVAYAICGRVQ
jgi:hypothetical protein